LGRICPNVRVCVRMHTLGLSGTDDESGDSSWSSGHSTLPGPSSALMRTDDDDDSISDEPSRTCALRLRARRVLCMRTLLVRQRAPCRRRSRSRAVSAPCPPETLHPAAQVAARCSGRCETHGRTPVRTPRERTVTDTHADGMAQQPRRRTGPTLDATAPPPQSRTSLQFQNQSQRHDVGTPRVACCSDACCSDAYCSVAVLSCCSVAVMHVAALQCR
jgi:hypothetical protein